MVDARMRGRGDLRLGMIGDTEACRLDHREVIRAVAGRERFVRREAEAVAQFDQRRALRLPAEDRLGDAAGEPFALGDQRIGAMLVETDHRGNAAGEQREAARDEAGISAVAPHGGDERAPARGERDALVDHVLDHRDRQILEQRHALAQRRLERDLAAHRALGDRRHMPFSPA